MTLDTWPLKLESVERINSICVTNGNFDSCNSCKQLVPSRLHELHESKFPFLTRNKFIPSKLSNFSAHVSGVYLVFGSCAYDEAWYCRSSAGQGHTHMWGGAPRLTAGRSPHAGNRYTARLPIRLRPNRFRFPLAVVMSVLVFAQLVELEVVTLHPMTTTKPSVLTTASIRHLMTIVDFQRNTEW